MKNQNIIYFLNQLLSNYFVMYVKLHRYHWYVKGTHFFQLHDKFHEMYQMFEIDIDIIAKRILMIDGKPFATMIKFLKETTLEEANADDKEMELIDQLIQDFNQIISEINGDGRRYAMEQEDELTLDLIHNLQARLEEYVWMLSAYRAYEDD